MFRKENGREKMDSFIHRTFFCYTCSSGSNSPPCFSSLLYMNVILFCGFDLDFIEALCPVSLGSLLLQRTKWHMYSGCKVLQRPKHNERERASERERCINITLQSKHGRSMD